MFKRRKPEPQDLQREQYTRLRQLGQDPLHITPGVSGEAKTSGVARRISPVLNTTAYNRASDDDSTRRPDKGPACFIADEHSHFASALSRRMERYVAELSDRARETEAPTLGEALSMCTPLGETQSCQEPLPLHSARTSSKSVPRRQAANDFFESSSPEWLASRPRATPSVQKDAPYEDVAQVLTRRVADDNNSSVGSYTISSWEPSAQPPRAAMSLPHRRQQGMQLLVLGAHPKKAPGSPRLQNPAALLLGTGRAGHSQTGRRREESCVQALAAIPKSDRSDRSRVPSIVAPTSSTS